MSEMGVTDNGIVISEEDLPHIFERYYRGNRTRHRSGARLGLPLVRGIVAAHEGRITVVSRLGKGSTFRVYLPSTGNGDVQGSAMIDEIG